MINEFKITPLNGGMSEMVMPSSYTAERGEVRVLLENNEFDNFNINKGVVPKGKAITFGGLTKSLTYKYEADETISTSHDKKIKRLVEVFFKQHPCFLINGESHDGTKAPLFNIEDLTQKNIQSVGSWDTKLAAANILKEMSLATKREVCYYYGEKPSEKTDGELKILLGDFTSGKIMAEKETQKFIDVWGAGENSERDLIVVAQKAIALNIIENRIGGDNRNNYYLGQTFIGTEFNDVIAFCKREDRIYRDTILRGVKEKDTFKKEEKASKAQAASADGPKQMTDGEIEDLRVEGKTLKAKGFIAGDVTIHLMKGEKLIAAITEGRKAKEEAEAKEIAKAQQAVV